MFMFSASSFAPHEGILFLRGFHEEAGNRPANKQTNTNSRADALQLHSYLEMAATNTTASCYDGDKYNNNNNNNHNSIQVSTDDGTGVLRRRSSPIQDPLLLLVHSFSESSFSRVTVSSATSTSSMINDDDTSSSSLTPLGGDDDSGRNKHHLFFSIKGIASSTFLLKRLSRSSSLSWGHKPSPYIGASCLFYLLPIPFFLRACAYPSAMLLLLVTISSYMSDHVYTGVESYAHLIDRALAPMAFLSCLYSTYVDCGYVWAATSLLAVKCHVWANYYARKGMYDEFVLWHCLWHGVGVGLIVLCYWWNDVVGSCWTMTTTTTTTTNHHEENGVLMWWLGESR